MIQNLRSTLRLRLFDANKLIIYANKLMKFNEAAAFGLRKVLQGNETSRIRVTCFGKFPKRVCFLAIFLRVKILTLI